VRGRDRSGTGSTDDVAAGAGVVGRPRRGPGLRVAVGTVLVGAAGVLTFAVHAAADDGPSATVLVARDEVAVGTTIADAGDARERFVARTVEVAPEVAGWFVAADDLEALTGRRVVAGLAPGDPLPASALGERVPEGVAFSFGLDRTDALDGSVAAGDRVDVLATTGSGERAATAFVLRDVHVHDVRTAEDGFGSRGGVTLTVGLPDPDDARALSHAVRTAEVALARSAGGAVSGP
jgi:Flp pilus assembly protein CpaB